MLDDAVIRNKMTKTPYMTILAKVWRIEVVFVVN